MAHISLQPSRRVLLDASPGPLHPAARDTLLAALDAGWADPRRLHREGRQARRLLDQAREVLAAGLGVRPPEVSFLPSGPTGLTHGVSGLLYAARRRGARVVAGAVEHSSLLVPGRHRAAMAEDPTLFEEVGVDGFGRIDLAAWEVALGRPGTVVAALQSVNGEIGTRQPLASAREAAARRGIPLLVDAMAGLGRDPAPADFDVLVGDARSWGGPGGVGLLVVPERTRWRLPGAVSELELGRTDVEPWVPLAMAAAEAWQQTAAVREEDSAEARELVDRIRAAAGAIPDTEVVGDPVERVAHVTTFSCLFVDGEAIVDELDRRGFAVASGSACTASTLAPSHVLAAMGVLTHGNVRVTLPLAATDPDRAAGVDAFCAALPDAVAAVRARLGTDRL
ncbi:aminotransferase class V-fold PLP-dependent enzyme [Lapillicoccus sp.]|uniref:cysteine desulfurase family protein n=1 Tax=Lapillicoccus sp. TaxID=1909287 RepID=UPI0025D00F04|nr:aminotransferase class V-fold PLP-dependent enzyme [Lapillicoccus sp.]